MDVEHLYKGLSFVWNSEKAESNLRKHDVSFKYACEVFFDSAAIYREASHGDEDRLAVIGITGQTDILFVVHLEASVDSIRIISARRATQREEREYEDG